MQAGSGKSDCYPSSAAWRSACGAVAVDLASFLYPCTAKWRELCAHCFRNNTETRFGGQNVNLKSRKMCHPRGTSDWLSQWQTGGRGILECPSNLASSGVLAVIYSRMHSVQTIINPTVLLEPTVITMADSRVAAGRQAYLWVYATSLSEIEMTIFSICNFAQAHF